MKHTCRHVVPWSIAIVLLVWQAACAKKTPDLSTPTCAYALAPAAAEFDNRGGAGALTIQTTSACAWTVANTDPWITFSGERSGTGTGAVSYAVAANTDPATRSATLVVGEQAATVTQAGEVVPNCKFTVEPTFGAYGAAGGGGTVSVSAPAECAWTSNSQVSWIGISSGSSGTGSGPVQYVVAANPSFNSRMGTLTVAGQVITVSQVGVGFTCRYTVAPLSASFTAAGGTGTVTVTAPAGCGWGAVSQVPWISIVAGSPGTSNGAVQYAVAANTSTASRTAAITVAGQSVTITQDAAAGIQ
jgi:hypothetical protein